MKVFVFDPLWNQLITDELEQKLVNSGAELLVYEDRKPLSECHELFDGDEDRILCLNPDYVDWKLGADGYKSIPSLKAILIASTAFSWVDMSYANHAGIPVCNIRHFSTEAVAEWAMMTMFSLARKTPLLIKTGFPLDFGEDYMRFRGIELKGKTAGIIGLGHNGAAIAERCQGIGMKVIYWSRSLKDSQHNRVELSQLMSTADVLFPTFAKNDETKGLMAGDVLGLVKPGAMIVDIIELSNKAEILEMVGDGKLFGYGFEASPESFDAYDGNVWAAPAYAWATDGSMNRSMEKWVENIVNALSNTYTTKVN